MKRALFAIAWLVGTASAMSFGVFLGSGIPLLSPFAALLGMVVTPFIFWMGLVARPHGVPTCEICKGSGCFSCGQDTHGVGIPRPDDDGWSDDPPNADGRWLWREGGKEHREVELVLCSGGAEVADPDDDTEESSQSYWRRTPTDQKNMPGLWKRPHGVSTREGSQE